MSLRINLPAPVTPPLPAFDVSVTLDGVTYTLRFQWNDSESAWFVRVLDEPGQTVLMGDCRLVADWPLYRGRTVRTPPGFLVVSDTSGQGVDPALADLGARVQLLYATADEVAALGVDA